MQRGTRCTPQLGLALAPGRKAADQEGRAAARLCRRTPNPATKRQQAAAKSRISDMECNASGVASVQCRTHCSPKTDSDRSSTHNFGTLPSRQTVHPGKHQAVSSRRQAQTPESVASAACGLRLGACLAFELFGLCPCALARCLLRVLLVHIGEDCCQQRGFWIADFGLSDP
jgi:hypothetical protein